MRAAIAAHSTTTQAARAAYRFHATVVDRCSGAADRDAREALAGLQKLKAHSAVQPVNLACHALFNLVLGLGD